MIGNVVIFRAPCAGKSSGIAIKSQAFDASYIIVSWTFVVWLRPVVVCAITVIVVVAPEVLVVDPGLGQKPHPIVLPPRRAIVMASNDSDRSLRNCLRRFDEMQRTSGKSANPKGARGESATFASALFEAVSIVIVTSKVPSGCFAGAPKLQVTPAGSPEQLNCGF